MSSILTNNSAMVALQTLKSINMDLGKVQSEISTGKTVESAKDYTTVWITFALDEYARCVLIISVNSPATSVVDSSRAKETMSPVGPSPASQRKNEPLCRDGKYVWLSKA